jgi:biotin synthesis protein BioG
MEAKWVAQSGGKPLILFFCGWGFDERCIQHLDAAHYDVVALYDYRSLDFPSSILEGYRSVTVVAWSFGVWVAGWLMEQHLLKADAAYAINGSLAPVSETEGISPTIFEGTIANLTEATLKKFRMRICGGARGYAQMEHLLPHRNFTEQYDELVALGEHFVRTPLARKEFWSSAIISTNDLIFPAQCLKNHWGDGAVTISGPHLCFGPMASWEELLGTGISLLKINGEAKGISEL